MGCITWPFKLLLLLIVAAALVGAWFYRFQLLDELRRLRGGPAIVSETGRPTEQALRSAQARVDSLVGSRADSVVLSSDEMASLIGAGLEPAVRRQLDSLSVELGSGAIEIRALLSTARLPNELVGPLSMALRPWEPIEAAGPVRVVDVGRAEWTVRRFKLRDFPFPDEMVPKLLGRALGDSARRALPVRLPRGIRDLRIAPDGVTLYGATRP